MKLTREEVLRLAVKAGFYFDVLPEHAPTQHTLPLHYSEECFHRFGVLLQTDSVNLAKPLAESAVAPGECGSVPDALAKIAKAWAVVVGLCDGSKRWTMSVPADVENDPDLVIADALATARRVLEAGMQPPNNQPNSVHVAVIGAKSDSVHLAVTSAKPESSLTDGIDLFALFEAGWSFHQSLQGHVLDGRDVGRLTGCEFWPVILQRMHVGTDLHVGLSVDEAIVRLKQEIKRRLTVAQQWQQHDQCRAAQSGMSAPNTTGQPNEKDVVGEGK